MSIMKLFGAATLLAATVTVPVVQAQDTIPGKDRPIRVGMFKGTGSGNRYWHTNIHTSHTVLSSILSNPAGAGLGDSLVVPPEGFTFYSMPIALNNAGTAECTGNGCGPNAAQINEFVGALDTLDVMILSSVVDFGSRVNNAAHRNAIADFWSRKGYVAIHAITDTYGTWAPLDTIHGTRFRGHPAEQNGNLRRDSAFMTDSAWQYLNRGVFSNGTDTTFFEEWFFFTTSGAAIRATAYLRPTTKLVESSLGNLGSQAAMGDHPHSWYRELPEGGRFFYTAVGHRSQVWQNIRSFRRQVYNGILWTAKYDSLANVVSIQPGRQARNFNELSRMSTAPGILSVTMLQPGTHSVELKGLDGRRVALRRGEGQSYEYTFTGLQSGVYAVTVNGAAGRSSRLVTVQ